MSGTGVFGGGVLMYLFQRLYQLGGGRFLTQTEAAIHPEVHLCI